MRLRFSILFCFIIDLSIIYILLIEDDDNDYKDIKRNDSSSHGRNITSITNELAQRKKESEKFANKIENLQGVRSKNVLTVNEDDGSESESGTETDRGSESGNKLHEAIARLKRKNSLPEGWGGEISKLSEKSRKKSLEKSRESEKFYGGTGGSKSKNASYDELDRNRVKERKKSMVRRSSKDGDEIEKYSGVSNKQVVGSSGVLKAKASFETQRQQSAR